MSKVQAFFFFSETQTNSFRLVVLYNISEGRNIGFILTLRIKVKNEFPKQDKQTRLLPPSRLNRCEDAKRALGNREFSAIQRTPSKAFPPFTQSGSSAAAAY